MTIKAIETEYNGYRFRSRLEARWAVFFDALGVEYEYEPEGFELPSGNRYLPDFRVKCYGTRGMCNPQKVKDESNLCYSCKYGNEDSYAYQYQCTNPNWTIETAEIDSDNNGQCCACELYELDRSIPFDLYIEVKGDMKDKDANKIREFVGKKPYIDEYDGKTYFLPENPLLIVGDIPKRGKSSDSRSLHVYDDINGTGLYPFNYETIDGDHFGAYPAGYHGRFYLWGDDSNYIHNVEEVENAYDEARKARFEHGETPVIAHE